MFNSQVFLESIKENENKNKETYYIVLNDFKIINVKICGYDDSELLVALEDEKEEVRKIAKKNKVSVKKINIVLSVPYSKIAFLSTSKKETLDKLKDIKKIDKEKFVNAWNKTSDEFEVSEFTVELAQVLKDRGFYSLVVYFDNKLYAIGLQDDLLILVKLKLLKLNLFSNKIEKIIADNKYILNEEQIYERVKTLYSPEEWSENLKKYKT